MPASILTTDDLREFKMELLEELKTLLQKQESPGVKRYLKSSEVLDYLQVSPGTLQNLRVNGTLPYTKVGGLIYYDVRDIEKVMAENKVHNSLKD